MAQKGQINTQSPNHPELRDCGKIDGSGKRVAQWTKGYAQQHICHKAPRCHPECSFSFEHDTR